ncbi:MAG: pitrilysin family protein, partial [candidate division WOR-3 bacterium]
MRDLFLGFLIFPILLVQKMGYQNIKEYTLKNGMKVLILEDNSSPIISLGIWYKVGSRNEVTGKTGISHLLEHMMFKGTKRIGSQEFSKIIQRIGGVDNAFTSNDATCYWEVFPKENLEKILELESDRMQNLVFREFEEEKKVVMEERRLRTENSPEGIFWEELYALSYKVHPYKNPVIGWMSDLENINLSDVKEHYKTYYSPNNAVMIIVG